MEVLWKAALDKHIFPFLHDRFAIVDRDLWHFGSTVGRRASGIDRCERTVVRNQNTSEEVFRRMLEIMP